MEMANGFTYQPVKSATTCHMGTIFATKRKTSIYYARKAFYPKQTTFFSSYLLLIHASQRTTGH